MHRRRTQQGFTLIEMIVAVALFAIVMLIAGATLLSLVYANRKAQALQSVINNLNVSLDGMVRNVREGENYRCGNSTNAESNSPGTDCTNTLTPATVIYFTPFGKSADNQPQDDYAYGLCQKSGSSWVLVNSQTSGASYSLCQDEAGGGWVPIIASQVQIKGGGFAIYVVGTKPASQGGTQQPKVIFTIEGQAGSQANTISTFDIQATAVQRVLNL